MYHVLCTVDGQNSPDPRIDSQCLETYYTLPKCIDHPDGYGCECGPGFHWNTKMCMCESRCLVGRSFLSTVLMIMCGRRVRVEKVMCLVHFWKRV